MRSGAFACLALWAVVTTFALLTPNPANEAVVIADETTLHTADSRGAPALLPTPLPAGTEVTMIERRDSWTRISLADGADGWVTAASIASILEKETSD